MPQLLALYRSELTARLSIDTVVGCFARALAAAPTPILLPGGAGVAQDGVTMAVGPHTVSAVEGSEGGVPASGSGPAVGALEGAGGAESQDQQQQQQQQQQQHRPDLPLLLSSVKFLEANAERVLSKRHPLRAQDAIGALLQAMGALFF
jgi:hypothetical protein